MCALPNKAFVQIWCLTKSNVVMICNQYFKILYPLMVSVPFLVLYLIKIPSFMILSSFLILLSAIQEELYSYCNRPRRTILEVLHDFPYSRAKIPFQYLFDLIPILQPRAFSIASSMQVSAKSLSSSHLSVCTLLSHCSGSS